MVVDGVNINYLRTGVGEHPVLLLPGAIGNFFLNNTSNKIISIHLFCIKFVILFSKIN